MTDIFTFSGVHGSGKTTVINSVANRLTKTGKSVFVLNEFPFIPDIPIGTMDFQVWYKNSMNKRGEVVKKLDGMFDIILLDRHPLDVDVYTSRLLHKEVENYSYIYIEGMVTGNRVGLRTGLPYVMEDGYNTMFLLERPRRELQISLRLRRMKETHRKEWNEEDDEYLKYIIETFRLYKLNNNVIFIENIDLDDTSEIVFQHITQRLEDR